MVGRKDSNNIQHVVFFFLWILLLTGQTDRQTDIVGKTFDPVGGTSTVVVVSCRLTQRISLGSEIPAESTGSFLRFLIAGLAMSHSSTPLFRKRFICREKIFIMTPRKRAV